MSSEEIDSELYDMMEEEEIKETPKPKRGRPKKVKPIDPIPEIKDEETDTGVKDEPKPKRGRGRPRKVVDPNAPVKPKRKCTEKQLAALAAGRAKNKRFHPKSKDDEE